MQTSIIPASFGPLGTANLLTLRGVGPVDDTGRPNYVADFASKTLVTAAIPAVPPVPATDETLEIPAVPAVPAVYAVAHIASRNVEMTKAQWDNWGKTPTDEEYQLACLCTNLGVVRA